jgi:ribosomal protein S18 acetylase RimI-like enzyme
MITTAAVHYELTGGFSVSLRETARPEDITAVRRITESSGFFHQGEIEVAAELIQARLSQGTASGYYFLFADTNEPIVETVGYSCFGPIPCTQGSFDLYWIAVHERFRGKGLGTLLLGESEVMIRRMAGRRIYAETSSRPQYEPTRGFYCSHGYRQEALIPEFYAPGDGKVIYSKEIN